MHFVHKIRGVADAHEGAAAVDVFLPSVNLLVVFERKIDPFICGLNDETEGL